MLGESGVGSLAGQREKAMSNRKQTVAGYQVSSAHGTEFQLPARGNLTLLPEPEPDLFGGQGHSRRQIFQAFGKGPGTPVP